MEEFKRNLLLRKSIHEVTYSNFYENLKSTIAVNIEAGSVRRIFWRGNYVVFEKMLSILN